MAVAGVAAGFGYGLRAGDMGGEIARWTVAALPLIWLCALALGLCAIGLAGLRHRDIG